MVTRYLLLLESMTIKEPICAKDGFFAGNMLMSFLRKQESSVRNMFWTPAKVYPALDAGERLYDGFFVANILK